MAEPNKETIQIRVNERPASIDRGSTLWDVRRKYKPDADIVIFNGFPVAEDRVLENGDAVVLIRRGEIPPQEDLEALMMARHGPAEHAAVKRARVGIAGCGGLGSSVAIALARVGVGRLVLADFDVVEPSNLNRQQFFIDQIGQAKVDALASNIARINPFVAVERFPVRLTAANTVDVFRGCDAIAECFDAAEAKAELVTTVRTLLPDTPIVAASGIAGYGTARTIQSRRVLGKAFVVGDGESAAQPGRGLWAPRVLVAAGHQANIILRLLLGAIGSAEEG